MSLRPNTSKGVAGYALYVILGLFITSLIIGVLTGAYPETLNFFKEEVTDLQDDRIMNAAYALTSVPDGYVEMEINDYEVKVNNNEISVRYAETTSTTEISNTPLEAHYDDIGGLGSFTNVEGLICLRKTGDDLTVSKGACSGP